MLREIPENKTEVHKLFKNKHIVWYSFCMKTPKVYFYPYTTKNKNVQPHLVKQIFQKLIEENKIKLENELPLKIHPGQPGNETYIKPAAYTELIHYLQSKNIKTYFIETNVAGGPRSNRTTHIKAALGHGFNQIPYIVADGENGFDQIEIPIQGGKYFKTCKIAAKLASLNQIIVMSHFKGHIMSGFGGAIKMLGIGFASKRGKIEEHSKGVVPDNKTVDWSQMGSLYSGSTFRERTVEYALAAVNHKQYIYITFAENITANCDCDGEKMPLIYKDLGIFASTDPVAIDKACFDLLAKREGEKPFEGEDIFEYAEHLKLGTQQYELVTL